MYNKELICANTKIKITNKETNELICCDFIKCHKIGCDKLVFYGEDQLVSVDEKYFFRIKNPIFNIEIAKEEDPIVHFNPVNLKDVRVQLWRNYLADPTAVVYRDFTINELDPEVKNLVAALNKIDGIETTGSCSGHGKNYLWVKIGIKKLNALHPLLYLIYSGFYNYMQISTDGIYVCREGSIELTLKTKDNIIGEQAYKYAETFAEALNLITESN